MDEFASACVGVRDRVLSSDMAEGLDAAWLEYVRDDSRVTEAASMTACVARLVTSELHPPVTALPSDGSRVESRHSADCSPTSGGTNPLSAGSSWSPWPTATSR